MGAIFLSHSSQDNGTTAEIAAWLKARMFEALFLDFDPQLGIPAGRDWEKELQRQLDRCEAVIVLCSAHSVASQWCLSEVAIADHLGKPIFPVKIGPCEPFRLLSDRQWIDFTTNPEEALERLARGLQVAGLDPANSFPWAPGRCPYPGLLAFEEADAAVFFGREGEISQGQQALRQLRTYGGKGLLLVLGASGCGKSSLVRAGLLPRLRRDPGAWLVLEPFRPRVDPFLELATSLARAHAGLGKTRDPEQIVAELEGDGSGEAFAAALDGQLEELRRRTGQREASAVVTVDQFEELLLGGATAGSGSSGGGNGGGGARAKADRFLAGLRAALAPANGKLVVLGTLRSDFLGLLQSHPALLELPFEQLLVGPLGPGAYTRIIEGPARVAGVALETGLSERMVADTASGDAQTGDALPLLAFTLRKLWEPERGLTLAGYDSLGGLVGSVRKAADGVLNARTLNPAQTSDLRQAFLAMTRINEQSQYCRRPALWSEMPPNSLEILQRFVAARLLVSGKDTGLVEVAHEALLRTWDTLKTWLDDNRAFLLWRQRLEASLAEYDSNGTLLRDQQLQEAESWRASTAPESRARQLIDASLRARKRQRFTRRVLAGAAVSVLAAFAGGSWWQLQAIRAAQAAQFEATHRTLISSDPFMSVVYGLAAAKPLLGGTKPWEAAQLSQSLREAVEANWARSVPIATGQGPVWSLIELKNGELISGGFDGTMRRWRDGKPVGDGKPIATGQELVLSLIELKNGELISGGRDGTLRRWRDGQPVGDGKPIATGQGGVWSLIELKNGELISGGDDGTLRRWRDGKPVGDGKPIATGQGKVRSL
ncbi:MAG: TIR domain-containing protein, partial [Cyanobacteriota bacterium]